MKENGHLTIGVRAARTPTITIAIEIYEMEFYL